MERNLRKERIGVVVSNKMEKTIVVAVARKVKHPIYGKFVNKTTKFVAESLDETCKEGDTVRIMETRPPSRIISAIRLKHKPHFKQISEPGGDIAQTVCVHNGVGGYECAFAALNFERAICGEYSYRFPER